MVAAAARAGYKAIGFVDGAIEPTEAVPLSELRDVLADPSVGLIGGASMGALSAAQLRSQGMRGVGRAFKLLCRGVLSGADELYLLHAPDALRYRALTLPMVNVRYTLRAMRRAGHISEEEERSMLAYMLTVPWFDRDSNCLSAAAYQACGHARSSRVQQKFDAMYRDIKREDARHVLAILSRTSNVSEHRHTTDRRRRVDDGSRDAL